MKIFIANSLAVHALFSFDFNIFVCIMWFFAFLFWIIFDFFMALFQYTRLLNLFVLVYSVLNLLEFDTFFCWVQFFCQIFYKCFTCLVKTFMCFLSFFCFIKYELLVVYDSIFSYTNYQCCF